MITELIGKTVVSVEYLKKNSDQLIFRCSDGAVFRMYHYQDCCESVRIEDVVGDVHDIIGSPILSAEEKTNSEDTFGKIEYPESFTWTFYTIATAKGYLDIRWLGESNGYYSESVEFKQINDEL
jgi:hypothetical protein